MEGRKKRNVQFLSVKRMNKQKTLAMLFKASPFGGGLEGASNLQL